MALLRTVEPRSRAEVRCELNRTGFECRSIWALKCPSLAFVSGDNDGMPGVVMVMVLQIVAGLVSALLSISRLNLKGQNLDAQGGTWNGKL